MRESAECEADGCPSTIERDWPAQRRNHTDEQGSCDGMRVTMQDGLVLKQTDQGLDIHQNLCPAKYHEAEMAPADGFEESSRA